MAANHRPAHLLQAASFVSRNCINEVDIFKFGDLRRKFLLKEAALVENYMLAHIDSHFSNDQSNQRRYRGMSPEYNLPSRNNNTDERANAVADCYDIGRLRIFCVATGERNTGGKKYGTHLRQPSQPRLCLRNLQALNRQRLTVEPVNVFHPFVANAALIIEKNDIAGAFWMAADF